jgi:hypothetical protein
MLKRSAEAVTWQPGWDWYRVRRQQVANLGCCASHYFLECLQAFALDEAHAGFCMQLRGGEGLRHMSAPGAGLILMISSHMPPVPPANRSKKGRGSDPEISKDTSVKQPEHHHNAAEEGETANIKQNKTNKGFFRGRRFG